MIFAIFKVKVSVERAAQDLDNILGQWLQDNITKSGARARSYIIKKDRDFHHLNYR